MHRFEGLSANALKIVALITMTIDHIGCILFPEIEWLRIVGRIAFPLYAYFISEGCRYTKNKTKYFLKIFGLGIICQFCEYAFQGQGKLNILITFSFSILLVYCFQWVKKSFKNNNIGQKIFSVYTFIIAIVIIFYITSLTSSMLNVDYGFCGILLPLLIGVFDNRRLKLAMFVLGQALLCLCANSTIQWACLFSCLLMLAYNGTRGKYNLKYLFYIYYPVHLNLLWLIAYLI